MRDSHRSRRLRASVLVAAGAAFLSVLAAPATQAQDEPAAAGGTIVGELVQAYVDPLEAPESGDHEEQGHDDGLLSWIRTDSGDAVRVTTEELPAVEVGSTVEVTVGDEVVDEAAEDGLEPALEVLGTEVLAAPDEPVVASTTATVNHPVTVVMLQPAGVARDATTLTDMTTVVNGVVADFWDQQTRGAVRFGVAATVDWGSPATVGCDQPFELWKQAAARAGWTWTDNAHLLVYVPPGDPTCAAGLGTVGRTLGDGGLSYVTSTTPSVTAHEFGHNLGLGHSSQIQCDRSVDAGACRTAPYRDLYDVMGLSWGEIGTLNAAQADRLGLLVAGEVGRIGPTAAPTEVVLAPAATVPTDGALRVVDLTDVDGSRYWLEYRQATGQDTWLGTSARNVYGLQQGVTLRRSVTGSDTSLLLDGTPSGRTGWGGDLSVALPVGTRVVVGQAAFALTVLDASSTAARVQISVVHPVDLAYQRLGGAAVLGAATTGRMCGLRDGGCFTHYERGSIYWSKATGARGVMHSPRDRWASLGWENGLGYPLTDTICGLRDGGCFQHFEGGSLYATGTQARAHLSQGRTRDRWAASGWENGPLGFPTSDTLCGLRDGGCFQHFQSGSVYFSTGTGARLVGAAVRQRWAATGWENGRLGYPVGDQACGLPDSGCFVHFQGGSVYVSASTGAHDLVGPVRDRWAASGWERGPLGYPVTSTVCGLRDGGCFQHFQRGSVYWSPATGARLVDPATRGVWAASGWEGGALGYPVSDQTCGLVREGCFVHFQRGSVYTSPQSGSHAVAGWVRDAWAASGWERSTLGYPVEGRRYFSDGESQRFQGGTLRLYYRTGQVRVV